MRKNQFISAGLKKATKTNRAAASKYAQIFAQPKRKYTRRSTSIKIEKNVPLPNGQMVSHSKYPFHKMKVGNSFALPAKMYSRLSPAASAFKKKNRDFNFTIRKMGNKVRVWRIKK